MLRCAWSCLCVLVFVGCSAAPGKKRADGTYVFDCSEHKRCFDNAKEACGEQGYIMVGGKSNKQKYGTPGNEVYIGKDEIYIRCNRDRPADAPDADTGDWSLRRQGNVPSKSAEPKADVASPTASAAPRGAQVCRPGETQRCFGPGACEGGQACTPDGTRFGPCDCGGNAADSKDADTPASPADGAAPSPAR